MILMIEYVPCWLHVFWFDDNHGIGFCYVGEVWVRIKGGEKWHQSKGRRIKGQFDHFFFVGLL